MLNRPNNNQQQDLGLNYYEQDKDGNSPLLKAARPSMRANALVWLQQAIKAGTRKYRLTDTPDISAQLPGQEQPVSFKQYLLTENPDDAFTALGITREKLFDLFLPLSIDENAPTFLAEEISNFFIDGSLEIPKDDQQIKKLIREGKEGQKELLNYCSQQTIFEYYLQQLKNTKLSLGFYSLALFSTRSMILLYVWQYPNNTNEIILTDIINAETEQKNILHVLYIKSLNKFNLLTESHQPSLPLKQISTYIDMDYLTAINKYRHNLLHITVRSIAPDILVPYLINQCGFKDIINARDQFGKTAFHRLIKFYAEERDYIIQRLTSEMGNEAEATKEYFGIFNQCLIEFISAGADIDHIKDENGLTVLGRARLYNSKFKWENPQYKLDDSLISLKATLQPNATTTTSSASPSTPVSRSIFSSHASQDKRPVTTPSKRKK